MLRDNSQQQHCSSQRQPSFTAHVTPTTSCCVQQQTTYLSIPVSQQIISAVGLLCVANNCRKTATATGDAQQRRLISTHNRGPNVRKYTPNRHDRLLVTSVSQLYGGLVAATIDFMPPQQQFCDVIRCDVLFFADQFKVNCYNACLL